MARKIIYASTLMTSLNRLISTSEVTDMVDAAIIAALNTFDPLINYDQDDIVFYNGFFYEASVNIGASVTTPDLNTNWRPKLAFSYTSTASAATTTTLTFRASLTQRISGTTTHIFTLPVTSTLRLGHRYYFINDSTGAVTINSSGSNLIVTLQAGERCYIDCILLSGTTAASWSATTIGLPLNAQNLGDLIQGLTQKATPIDADRFGYWDSVADTAKYALGSDIKAWQKAYNDTLYDTIKNYQTIATAAGTTTLTATSPSETFFTGSTTQNCDMPVASTLYAGWQRKIVNNSTGLVTVRSSGANTIVILAAGTSATMICILASGTSAASWHAIYKGESVTSGKKLSATNTLEFTGTDGTSHALPSSNSTLARRDAAQDFTGTQTFNNYVQLSENGGVLSDQVLSADGKFCIESGFIGTLGETVAFAQLCYLKAADSKWWLADSDVKAQSGNVRLAFCCVAGVANDQVQMMKKGKIRADSLFPTLTVGAPAHVSSTAGSIVVNAPIVGISRIVGHANTTDELEVDISDEYEEMNTLSPTDGSGASLSLTINSAKEIRKGRFISTNIDVTYPTTASGANAQINGCCTYSPNTLTPAVVNPHYTGGALGSDIEAYYDSGNTYIQIYDNTVQLTNANLTGHRVYFAANFITSSNL